MQHFKILKRLCISFIVHEDEASWMTENTATMISPLFIVKNMKDEGTEDVKEDQTKSSGRAM